jgi:hypothetical protein
MFRGMDWALAVPREESLPLPADRTAGSPLCICYPRAEARALPGLAGGAFPQPDCTVGAGLPHSGGALSWAENGEDRSPGTDAGSPSKPRLFVRLRLKARQWFNA